MNYAGVFTDKEGNKYYPDIKELKTISGSLSSVGWYRVAKLGYSQWGLLICISTQYNYNNNLSAIVSLNMAHQTASLTNISSQINSSTISQVRVAKDDGDNYYIEIYYSASSSNPININIFDLGHRKNKPIQMLEFTQAESAETIMDTIVLAKTTSLTLINDWEPFTSGSNSIIVQGGIATLTLGIKNGTQKTALYLPEGFRPKVGRYYPCVEITTKAGYVCYISVNGAVQIENVFVNNSSQVFINVSFEVA